MDVEYSKVKVCEENMPFTITSEWLDKEEALGSPVSDCAVLATATASGIPHSRVVAIREISSQGILFFTQRDKRKAKEIAENPRGSMTFWLALQQREIILDGTFIALSSNENEQYWRSLPRERQLRFSTYAPSSDKTINSSCELDERFAMLESKFDGKEVPMSEFYCGFRLIPQVFYFYTLGNNSFSELIKYSIDKNSWKKELLSP